MLYKMGSKQSMRPNMNVVLTFLKNNNYYLQNFCKELKSPSREQEKSLKLRRNEVTGEIEIKCVFERMDEYLKVCYK